MVLSGVADVGRYLVTRTIRGLSAASLGRDTRCWNRGKAARSPWMALSAIQPRRWMSNLRRQPTVTDLPEVHVYCSTWRIAEVLQQRRKTQRAIVVAAATDMETPLLNSNSPAEPRGDAPPGRQLIQSHGWILTFSVPESHLGPQRRPCSYWLGCQANNYPSAYLAYRSPQALPAAGPNRVDRRGGPSIVTGRSHNAPARRGVAAMASLFPDAPSRRRGRRRAQNHGGAAAGWGTAPAGT